MDFPINLNNNDTKPLLIGHRGAKGLVLENTLESFLKAIDSGVDGIELDIRATKFGDLIVYHDETFNRLAVKNSFYFKYVHDKKVEDLQIYHVDHINLTDNMGKTYNVLKLEDLLRREEIYDSDLLINLEIKEMSACEPLTELLLNLFEENLYDPDSFLISSYIPEVVIYFDQLLSDVSLEKIYSLGLIIDNKDDLTNLENINSQIASDLTIIIDIDFYQEFYRCQEYGENKVFVFTVNDPRTLKNLKDINGIITDFPNRY